MTVVAPFENLLCKPIACACIDSGAIHNSSLLPVIGGCAHCAPGQTDDTGGAGNPKASCLVKAAGIHAKVGGSLDYPVAPEAFAASMAGAISSGLVT